MPTWAGSSQFLVQRNILLVLSKKTNTFSQVKQCTQWTKIIYLIWVSFMRFCNIMKYLNTQQLWETEQQQAPDHLQICSISSFHICSNKK